jgi:NADH:ubiquinone oxidoreductase subunit 2 (subunit N)
MAGIPPMAGFFSKLTYIYFSDKIFWITAFVDWLKHNQHYYYPDSLNYALTVKGKISLN